MLKVKFIIRNLLLYYKDISNIIFSFLGMLISLIIYIFFLKNTLVNSFSNIANAAKFIDSWMIAGLISIVSVTSALSGFEQMLEDKNSTRIVDFIINSHINKITIEILYFITAIIEAIISTIIFIIICFAYLESQYRINLTIQKIGKILFSVLLLIIFSTLLFYLVVSFIKASSSFASLSALVGTVTGFLSGSYIVFGDLPNVMKQLLHYWPGFEVAALIRGSLCPIGNIPHSILIQLGIVDNNYPIFITSIEILFLFMVNYIKLIIAKNKKA